LKTIYSAEIVSVGTELLMGQTVNTNAAFIAGELAAAGIPSYRQSVVGDNPGRLQQVLAEAVSRAALVIVTGGLGPTEDDITSECTAAFLGRKLVFDETSADRIKAYFNDSGREMPSSNLKQAMIPEGSVALPNVKGTAPGVLLEFGTDLGPGDEKIIILLPGPPSEMRSMFSEQVLPYIESKAPVRMRSEYIRIFGIGESAAEEMIRDLIDDSVNPTIAPYCSDGECMFRVTLTKLEGAADDDSSLLRIVQEIRDRLGEYAYEVGSRSLPEVAFDFLCERSETISLAESCTGGMIGAALTDIPGSSGVFKGGVTVYSNDSKIRLLGIDGDLIEKYGAVSRETAEAMACSCMKLFGTDHSLSVTGVAGPGESERKPAGTVFMCLASAKGTVAFRELKINRDRNGVRRMSVLNAFDMIRRELSGI